VNEKTDAELIRTYAESRLEAAFTEIVRRHLDLVYSAARRMVRDSHLAEDVTQAVFVALAKNAAQLTDRPVLSGVAVGASGLAIGISANAVQAAPAGLVATISNTAVMAGTTLAATTAVLTKTIIMTTPMKLRN
jgi:hypothetical protein